MSSLFIIGYDIDEIQNRGGGFDLLILGKVKWTAHCFVASIGLYSLKIQTILGHLQLSNQWIYIFFCSCVHAVMFSAHTFKSLKVKQCLCRLINLNLNHKLFEIYRWGVKLINVAQLNLKRKIVPNFYYLCVSNLFSSINPFLFIQIFSFASSNSSYNRLRFFKHLKQIPFKGCVC